MARYFEFEVSLAYTRPRLWRRFLLPEEATFSDLHCAIQDAGPWFDEHLWEFRKPGRRGESIAGVPAPKGGLFGGRQVPDARKVRLSGVFRRPKDKCVYVYDFGDCWEHEVVLRTVTEHPEKFRRRLLAGQGAFPPEDCGGIPGYYECLAAVGATEYDKSHPDAPSAEELAERREWLGDWKPKFNLSTAQKAFDC
jgi:uncharacterized protein